MRDAANTTRSGIASRVSGARSRAAICALGAAVCLLLALSASASALSQRGHVFSEAQSFGTEGSGAGQLKEPSGVAVSEETGDIYVVDSGNNRVDRFNEKHEFVEAWGWGVRTGEKALQKCTTESGCKAGIAGHGKGQLHGARAIAVDNSKSKSDPSAGDVFVEAVTPFEEEVNGHEKEFEYGIFDHFSPSGELRDTINTWREEGSTEKFEEPGGIAVSPDGTLWIYNEENLIVLATEFKNEKFKTRFLKNVESQAEPSNQYGLAVDSQGNFFVGHEGTGKGEVPTVISKQAVIEENGEFLGEPLIEALDGESSTAVAVDEANNDPLVDNVESVAVFTPGGELVERIGAGVLHSGAGIAAANNGDVFVADAATGRVDAFPPEPAGAPVVDELSVESVTEGGVRLDARVDAHGALTTYSFRYSAGGVPSAGEACTGSCVEAPVGGEAIGEAFGDVPTHQDVTGLAPSTVYHYRVIAHNANGTVTSAEAHFKTLATFLGATLPDHRAWELVSPLSKNGAAIEAPTVEGGLIESSEDGEALTYVSNGGIPGAEGNRAPEVTQIVSRRGGSSWSSTDTDTKNEIAEGIAPGSASEYRAFSSTLSQSVVVPYGNLPEERPKLNEAATERTPYLRNDEAACLVSPAPEACFAPLVTEGNVAPGVEFGGKLKYVGADPGLDHIVISSEPKALTAEPAAVGRNLYDWSSGALHLINILPEGTPAARAELGLANRNVQRAVSSDGSRFAWSTTSSAVAEQPEHLYMRDMARGETVQVDKVQEGVPSGSGIPTFVSASTDLSRIFFLDEQRLTTNSTADQVHFKQDLYECEVVEDKSTHKLGCKLTDLTVDSHAGEAANVQGVVPDVGTEGTTVYFVANGVLASGASAGHCTKGEEANNEGRLALIATCNLYVSRFNGTSWSPPKLVAILGAEDEADWSEWAIRGYHGRETARVSPDGHLLAFMSDRSLTGSPNRDVTSGKPDEEVFTYDANAESLTCVSCNPFGARPTGVFDNEFAGEGRGLLVDRPLTWKGRWISGSIPGWTKASVNEAPYESRYLYNSGRIFFTSSEALVPQDKNGKEDVYEYEPPGVGECTTASSTYSEDSHGCVSMISLGASTHESAFLDASATGNDAFLLTASQLAAQDTDTSFDVYDAGICGVGGAHACLPPPAASPEPCVEEACRPDATSPPPFLTPSSVTPNGSGNTGKQEVLGTKEATKAKAKAKPLTRAQKLAKALKSCKKLKQHKKRVACERAARKKYGPVSKKAKKSAAKKSAVHHGASARGR